MPQFLQSKNKNKNMNRHGDSDLKPDSDPSQPYHVNCMVGLQEY